VYSIPKAKSDDANLVGCNVRPGAVESDALVLIV
jgi:hypothetical protein